MASYTFKGTGITGKSTTAKVFPNSGVKSARKANTYLNTSTGYVYQCTKAGKPKVAKWKYLRTDVVLKPTSAVTNLVTKRDGVKYTATWKVPANATSTDRGDRFTEIYVYWRIDDLTKATAKDPLETVILKSPSSTTEAAYLSNFAGRVTRNSFYPLTSSKVGSIVCTVKGHNPKGFSTAKAAAYSYAFRVPRAPVVSWSYAEETGRATVTVTTDPGIDNYERYDTMIYIEVLKPGESKPTVIRDWRAETKTEWSATYDTSTYGAIGAGEKMTFTCKAYARGLAGDNPAKDKAVTASTTVAIPNATTIEDITVSSKETTGRVLVRLKKVGDYATSLQLQRRHGEDGSWEDVEGGVDDGSAVALYDSVGLADPHVGEYIYYRILSKRGMYITTSEHFRADALFTAAPSLASIACGIVSLVPGDDGRSAKVVVGWNGEDRDGTEVSWSEDPYAWESTDQPSIFELRWQDAESQSTDWEHTTTLYIGGLDEGKTYYVKARNFVELETGVLYSEYAASDAVTPEIQPSNVTLVAPAALNRGETISVFWTFDGGARQTEWVVEDVENERPIASGSDAIGSAVVSPAMYGDAQSITLRVGVRAGGEMAYSNPQTVTFYDPPEIELEAPGILTAQPAEFTLYSDDVGIRVLAKCISNGIVKNEPDRNRDQVAGDVVWTDAITPTGWESVQWSDTALYSLREDALQEAQSALQAAQGAWDTASSGDVGLQALYSDLSDIEDEMEQAEGTDEYQQWAEAYIGKLDEIEAYISGSATLQPLDVSLADAQAVADAAQQALDALGGATNAATVRMADGVDFVDGATYQLEVTAVGTVSGLVSETRAASFDVSWTHQAPTPPVDLQIDVDDAKRTATIHLQPPTGAAQTDVYDLYRQTRSGFDLIRGALAMDSTVVDKYPAFSDGVIGYRICTRTIDGDLAWFDYEYLLSVDSLRFDWQDGFLELPYSIQYSDTFSKDFEARQHLNGEIEGYWNNAVNRSGSYGALLIKERDAGAISHMQRLADYPGAVFCRTPRGDAFQCNVDLSETDSEATMLDSASFAITRVALTSEFMVSKDDILDEVEADAGVEPEPDMEDIPEEGDTPPVDDEDDEDEEQ